MFATSATCPILILTLNLTCTRRLTLISALRKVLTLILILIPLPLPHSDERRGLQRRCARAAAEPFRLRQCVLVKSEPVKYQVQERGVRARPGSAGALGVLW